MTSSQPIQYTGIVGAGFSGPYVRQKFRKLRFTVCTFQAAADVGGTWYCNEYPSARCDAETLDCSLSFSEELQQDWEWIERYSNQPEILRYARYPADRFGLRDAISFKTRATGAESDPSDRTSTISTDK